MATRTELIEAIAKTIADYRAGEIKQPDSKHVESWIVQFPKEDQSQVLAEMAHVLNQSYIERKTVIGFINGLISNNALTEKNPAAFWKKVNFLDIQKEGSSQTDLLKLFNDSLKSQLNFETGQCGGGDVFVYLDDVIFSGARAGSDLEPWIRNSAPQAAKLHIIVMAEHAFGVWKMRDRLKEAATQAKKKIDLHVWRLLSIENRLNCRDNSDVLWPTSLPKEAQEYAARKFPFVPRTAGGASKMFSGEEGRNALEQALLRAGMRIRGFSAKPSPALLPLGFSPFGVGFGSTIVTYRNCPNNAPLALWWGDPAADPRHPFSKWRPLVPRKTYGGVEF